MGSVLDGTDNTGHWIGHGSSLVEELEREIVKREDGVLGAIVARMVFSQLGLPERLAGDKAEAEGHQDEEAE